MATEEQIAANRQNAGDSTGPKTEAGKNRSRRNSLRRGLLSRDLVLPWEDEREFRKLVNALLAEHAPEGATEVLLVEQMAVATWKLARLTGIERATIWNRCDHFLTSSVNPGKSSEHKFLHVLSHSLPTNLQALLNYEHLLNKAFHRALSTLRNLQDKRQEAIVGEAVALPDNE